MYVSNIIIIIMFYEKCAEIASDLAITLALSVIINLLVESPSRKIINHMKTKFFNGKNNNH